MLLPECLDDYIDEDNPVRAVDVFVDELDLVHLGFERAQPAGTGRPAYHPATLLKLYIYGYLNRIQSSRRLERETQRNLELIWLTGRLTPDFKTIADFRSDNGAAIRRSAGSSLCCAGSWACSRRLWSPSMAASSRRSTTATRTSPIGSCRRAWSSSKRALRTTWPSSIVQTANRLVSEAVCLDLKEKIATSRDKCSLWTDRSTDATIADHQVSLTDPDARSMATSGRGTGIVGYNVQTAVDAKHHLIVAHDVTNLGHDRTQLSQWPTAGRTHWQGDLTVWPTAATSMASKS